MRSIRIAALAVLAVSCGSNSLNDYQNKCVSPRPGTSDRSGTLDDEKNFLRLWTDQYYLWYREVPALDLHAAMYAKVEDYFADLKTPATTASGSPKDKFHFTIGTAEWQQESQSGVSVGYGVTWVALASRCASNGSNGCAPRDWRIGYVEPGSPAAANGKVKRGARVQLIDGADFINGTDTATINTLNAGLSPGAKGETHSFTLQDVDGTIHTEQLAADSITETPVVPIALANNVGYILFKDHIATAEQGLISAINQFNTPSKVSELVLDLRYNGGGFLYIASELAYMIAGPTQVAGKFFEQLTYNDRYGTKDPFDPTASTQTPFYTQSTAGAPLPHLDLKRVFVLSGPGTCSASESVINSLQGVGVKVIQIGSTTCGKPYGFYPQDNCGTTYFSIQFKGVNYLNFGDYTDGFVPGGGGSNPAGCQVADDFNHGLGDPNEARLAAALAYISNPVCAAALTAGVMDGEVQKPVWRMNRILGGR